MLQTTADYIVDFMEEFKKVDIAKPAAPNFNWLECGDRHEWIKSNHWNCAPPSPALHWR